MAKRMWMMSCGHEAEREINPAFNIDETEMFWKTKGVCNACYAKAKATESSGGPLPPITGAKSDKQAGYAAICRSQILSKFDALIVAHCQPKDLPLLNGVRQGLANTTDAGHLCAYRQSVETGWLDKLIVVLGRNF